MTDVFWFPLTSFNIFYVAFIFNVIQVNVFTNPEFMLYPCYEKLVLFWKRKFSFIIRHLWYEIIHFLLGKNCDVNAKSLDGSTPLHSAVQSPYLKLRGLQCVRLLLTFGANPNLMDSRNNKPRDLISANSNDDNSYLLEIMNLIGKGSKSFSTSRYQCSFRGK